MDPASNSRPQSVPDRPTSPRRLPVLWWGFLAVVLLAELLTLSILFDAGVRADDPGWAGVALYWSPRVLRIALLGAGAAIVFGAWYLRDNLADIAGSERTILGRGMWLLGQLAAFTLFALVTSWAFDARTHQTTIGVLLGWLVLGVLTMALWAAAAVRPGAWPQLLRRAWRPLVAAAAVTALATLVARGAQQGWDTLAGPTLRAAHRLLSLVEPAAICDADTRQLGTPAFTVEVAPSCSGYEGMGLVVACVSLYLWYFRRDLRFPHALVLLPVGLALAWLTNVVRIVVLVLIGDRVSPELALGGFHSQAGWIAFNLVVLAVLVPTHWSGLFSRHRPGDGPATDGIATLAYLGPLLAATAVQMLAAALVPDPALAYPIRAIVAGAVLWYFWPWYDALRAVGTVSSAAGYSWSVSVGVAVFLVWVALVPATPLEEAADLFAGIPAWAAVGWFVLKAVGFVLVTPVVEELAFRGYLLRRVVAADFRAVPANRVHWPAFVLSSAIFGLLHGHLIAGTLAGMGYALVVYRTGRLRDAVVAHAVTNGSLLAVMALSGNWYE